MRTDSTLPLWVLAVATVAIVAACDRVNLTAPTGSTVSISVDRSVVPLGGQATVTAVVTESGGTPVHNGTSVTFQTTVGSLNPPTVETVNGVATTTFLAGQTSGVATIHAYSGGARTGSGNTSSGAATIRVGTAAAAGTISVTATPSSVSQSGGTVTISALVFDEQSNPLSGIPVQFVASTGSLNPTTALTDSNGIARTQLTTTSTATVDAIAGAAKGNVRVEASSAPSVEIGTLSPATPVVGQPVAFTVTASSGNSSAPRQVQTLEVNFGDGTSETRSNVTGQAAFTHTYGREGGYTITARAVDVAGNAGNASRAVIVARSTAPTVTLDISPNPADVNQIVGFSVTTSAPTGTQQPVESVRVFINGELAYSTTGSSGAFTRGFSATGTYTVIAEALDSAGNVGRTQKFLIVEP